MRSIFRAWLVGATCVVSVASTGCSTAPTCKVSPVEIEELREDVEGVEKNLAAARERADALSKELAVKQADLDSKRGKPDELRARLEELKRGSGRVEKPKPGDKTPAKPGAARSAAPAPSAASEKRGS